MVEPFSVWIRLGFSNLMSTMAASMSGPSVAGRLATVPRDPERPEEYEDAAEARTEDWPLCAAIADGATESMFAKEWAQTVARTLVKRRVGTEGSFRSAVSTMREDFQNRIENGPTARPWYVVAKATEGAYATTLSLVLDRDRTWRAVSIGDCCLFHLRERRLRTAWPMDSADAFTHRPALLSSHSSGQDLRPQGISGEWTADDSFVLATDAVAEWLLNEVDPGSRLFDLLDRETEEIEDVLSTARRDDSLRADDATLLILDVHGDDRTPVRS